MNEDKVASAGTGSEDNDLSHGLDQIRMEEARVLEAYTVAILTPEQLARELATLKSRRELLESLKLPDQFLTLF